MDACDLTPELVERVHDLLEGNCLAPVAGYEDRAMVVNGRTAWYTVRAYTDRVDCDCANGLSGRCSHALAAMAMWGQAMTDPFSGVLP
jgi:hypothetical protein